MKITICVNSFAPLMGGCEIVTQKIAEHLSLNHKVTVLTRSNKKRRGQPISYKILGYNYTDHRSFDSLLVQSSPDLVFVYSDVFDFFQRLISIPRARFRIVLAPCGANWLHSHPNYMRILNRQYDNIKSVICHSIYDRDYRLFSSGNLTNKLFVIPNGVDTEEFDSNTLTRQDLCPEIENKKWLLNVSNFFPGKGQEHIINILDKLPNKEDYSYLQISSNIDFSIGKTLENKWNNQVMQCHNLDIRWLKNLSRQDTIGYFKNSNVFVFTSEKEVAPIVTLESMAARLPWVSTDIGNVQGLQGGVYVPAIKDRRHHSIIDGRVHGLFAKNIQELCNNPNIGDQGRSQIDNELTWDKILPKYSEIIER